MEEEEEEEDEEEEEENEEEKEQQKPKFVLSLLRREVVEVPAAFTLVSEAGTTNPSTPVHPIYIIIIIL
ncbi:hypothetical protein Pcinc_038642, partial [Petrolisthes cinctipes]